MNGPVEFRPMAGLLSLGSRLAHAAGLGNLWDGPEGLGEVAREKLVEWGVPDRPIQITGPGSSVTPRSLAEHAGIVKRRRTKKCTG